jgi:hypothetical protein
MADDMGLRFGKEASRVVDWISPSRVHASYFGPNLDSIAVRIILAAFQIDHLDLIDTKMSVGGIKHDMQLDSHGSKLLTAENHSDDYTRQAEQSHNDRVQDGRPLAGASEGSDRIRTRYGVTRHRGVGVFRNAVGEHYTSMESNIDIETCRVTRGGYLRGCGDEMFWCLCRGGQSAAMRHSERTEAERQQDVMDLDLDHVAKFNNEAEMRGSRVVLESWTSLQIHISKEKFGLYA